MNNRSRRRRRGLPTWRLRTISWWRRTTTSTSAFISSLEGPAINRTTRRSNRYTRAKNTNRTSDEKEGRSYERHGRGDDQSFVVPFKVDGAIGRCAQIGSTPNLSCSRRCRRSSPWSAVELRPEESRRGAQDLVGPSEHVVLPLQLLHPRPLLGRQAWPEAVIDLGPADPAAQRLRR